MFCPKCQMEYIAGITTCPDCHVDLVEALDEENTDTNPYIVICSTGEAVSQRILEYLEYSGITTASRVYDEDSGEWFISVRESEADLAFKHAGVIVSNEFATPDAMKEYEEKSTRPQYSFSKDEYLSEFDYTDAEHEEAKKAAGESKSADSKSDASKSGGTMEYSLKSDGASEAAAIPNSSNVHLMIPEEEPEKNPKYVSQKSKYEDYKSSAGAFLATGIICVAVLVLFLTKIIDLPLGSTTLIMLDVVLGIMAAFSFYIAVTSGIRAKKLKGEVDAEEDFTGKILSDFKEKHSKEELEKIIARLHFGEVSFQNNDPLVQFQRLEIIKSLLRKDVPDLKDESLLDELTDSLYTRLYGVEPEEVDPDALISQ